jgi:nucleotide-binding universal stress UspA family protein
MAERRPFLVRRIVVAADCSAHGRAAMEAAAALGALLGAELEGLFVEDVDVVTVAELAVGRELHAISGRPRALDREALERELRAEAAQARRALERVAGRSHVSVSFRVVRGRVEREVIAAAGEADMLVLGTASRSLGAHHRPGSTAVAAAERAPRSVLFLRSGSAVSGRVVALYDGSPGAARALQAGARLSAADGGALTVLLVAPAAEAAALRAEAERDLEEWKVNARFLHTTAADLRDLCRLAAESRGAVLVLSADSPLLGERGHRELLARTGCPILLVREA